MENMRTKPPAGVNARYSQFFFALIGLLVLAAGFYMASTWLFAH